MCSTQRAVPGPSLGGPESRQVPNGETLVGLAGWVAVGVVVVAADAWAIRRGDRTMSSVFAKWRGVAVPAWAAVTAHLIIHEAA